MEVTDSSLIWAASNLSLVVGAHNALSCQGDGRLEGFSIVIAQAQPEASLVTMFYAMMQKEAIFWNVIWNSFIYITKIVINDLRGNQKKISNRNSNIVCKDVCKTGTSFFRV